MLSYLLRQVFNFIGVFYRTIRAFIVRRFTAVITYLRRLANFSRNAAKLAAASFQGLTATMKKPERREDYIETQRLFISKSFLVMLLAGLIAAGVLIYFVIWPFILSHFLTARFYQGDERVPEWTGRVIVYSDKEKRIPKYSGKLVDGVLQGQGNAYDEQGLSIYEGNFVDGVYSGTGASYEEGVLVYRGQFQNGLYDGTGDLYEEGVLVYSGAFSAGIKNGLGIAYQNGEKRYEGSFLAGVRDGEGIEYYPSGDVEYKGSFSAGVREGQGTLYYQKGGRSYAGGFAEGLREGQGIEYREDGQIRYKGSFVQDLYEGSGSLYLENGDQIDAEFTAGENHGVIRWYRDKTLWFEGMADNLIPSGFGTVYMPDGRTVYAGQFDRGTVDGAWLLSLTAGEAREAFGDASLTESDLGNGFWIGNTDMGLWLLCSYQQEETEPQTQQVWFRPKSSPGTILLPWESQAEGALWATSSGGTAAGEIQGALASPEGSSVTLWQMKYGFEEYTCSILCARQDSRPDGIYWTGSNSAGSNAGTGTDAGTTASSGDTISQAQERLAELVDKLDKMGGGSDGGVTKGDVERVVALSLTASDAQDLIDALTDYLLCGETIQILEDERTLLERKAAEAQVALERGKGTLASLEYAQEMLEDVVLRLAQNEKRKKQALEDIAELCSLSPDDYELWPVLLAFDPVKLDAANLYQQALTYQKDVAAGRYEVDAHQLETDLRTRVLDISESYEYLTSQRRRLDQLLDNLDSQTAAYAKGTVSQGTLYDAQCAVYECVAGIYERLRSFNSQANAVNVLSGGWLSEQYDWLDEPMVNIFKGEVVRGQEAAAKLEQERADREAEAAQAIQEREEANKPQESQTLEQSPEQTPEQSPEQSPEQTPEQSPEQTPEQSPEQTPEQSPEQSPEQTPEQSPEQSPEQTPEQSPEQTPEQSPDQTPETNPEEETPKPEETPEPPKQDTPPVWVLGAAV